MAGSQNAGGGGVLAVEQPHAAQEQHSISGVSAGNMLQRLAGGGTDGNQRLTAATGALLVALLAVIGLTILALRQLLWVHLFVGMLLIGPVALKLASTGYRFIRYYSHNRAYRLIGPPQPLLRLLAPVVVVSTVVVFASGVALLLVGPSSRSTLLPIHKASFIIWLACTAVHVLGHLGTMPRALRADLSPHVTLAGYEPGRAGRLMALLGAVGVGLIIAVVALPDYGAWLHASNHFLHE